MNPFEIIVAIIDAAVPVERPQEAARASAPKNETGGREAAAPDAGAMLEGAARLERADRRRKARQAATTGDDTPGSAGEKKILQFPRKGARERDASAQNSEPCADGIAAENSADAPARPPKRRGKKKSGGDDGASTELFKPRKFGFDVGELNKEFALVLLGSKAVVFLEQPGARLEDQQRFLSVDAFRAWFANRFTERMGADGNIKATTWASAWLQSGQRRSFRGIEFFPDPKNTPGTAGYLNLWGGFSCEPAGAGAAGTYKTFRDHLFNNVCGGDAALFAWVFGFFAHIVQRPRERIGVALVMRGKMGSGKTKIGEVIGSLFPRHYFLVDDPRYVTGQFNAHMASCLLLQADEAVWAGDKTAEGRLKGLVTAPIQQIEAKGVDPIRLPNYVRLVMTSNEDWVWPAGKDERRACILDVDPRCAQNHDYFSEMDAELDAGGRERLLADLLAFDLSTVKLRQIPRTEALLEQKLRSLDSVDGWWFERLMHGSATRRASEWVAEIPCGTLFDDYINHAEKIGIRRKQEETVFGIKLAKLLPEIRRVRKVRQVLEADEDGGAPRTITKRVWCYALPSLDRARETFERIVGQDVQWLPIADEAAAPGGDDVAF